MSFSNSVMHSQCMMQFPSNTHSCRIRVHTRVEVYVHLSLPQNTDVGTALFTAMATDIDFGFNSLILYYIQGVTVSCACVRACVCACVHVCARACVHTCVCACVCVCVCSPLSHTPLIFSFPLSPLFPLFSAFLLFRVV